MRKNGKLFGLISIVIILAMAFVLAFSVVKQSKLERAREDCEQAIHLFLTGSDTLTNEVFEYTDTGAREHLDNYWIEAEQTRSREIAIATIKKQNLGESELEMLNDADKSSDALMLLEIHAMRLVAESMGMPEEEMPERVREYKLSPEESALSAQEKRLAASGVVFGRDYSTRKSGIVRSVKDFSFYLNERFSRIYSVNLKWTALLLVICFLTFLLCMFLYRYVSHTMMSARREKLRMHEESFRIVAEQTGHFVFQYDIPTRTYHHISAYNSPVEPPRTSIDPCEHMISLGLVSEESKGAFREFFAVLNSAQTPPDTDIKLVEAGGGERWYRFSAALIDGKNAAAPTMAVVSYADCGEQREREMAYSRWLQEVSVLSETDMSLLEWNLSQNTCENKGDRTVELLSQHGLTKFDETARTYASVHVCEQDRADFLALVNREKLLGLYHSGKYTESFEFCDDSCEPAQWLRAEIGLVMYPTSRDIKAYITATDISEEKQAELELREQSELDPLTGVLNRRVFAQRVSTLLKSGSCKNCLLLMIDIDNFKSYNDTFGHDFGDMLLMSFVGAARSELRQDDLLGRVGGDEFMICLPDISSEVAMEAKTGRLIRDLPRRISREKRVTVSIGAAVFPRDGASFNTLYKKADVALYRVKKTNKGDFCFYQENMEESETALAGIES